MIVDKQPYRNKHNLTRNIPEPIMRQIRQECGFGCVVCGNAIAQYEHIDPEFKDAKVHDPAKMAYLCGYCHDKGTRGMLSKATIKAARANPKSFKAGISKDVFDINPPFTVKIGSVTLENASNFIIIKGKPIIYMEPPEEEDAPARLTAYFYNNKGEPSLTIYKNELYVSTESWDFEYVGRRFTLRNGSRDIALEFIINPPNEITVTKLKMHYASTDVWLKDDVFYFKHPSWPTAGSMKNITLSGGFASITIK